ncbi:MAG: YIP1 family protein [Gemmatimonadota bacterium]|nr:YIP1 family protein [Gemmatimonadota bacterium]
MTSTPGSPSTPLAHSLPQRVIRILQTPKTEWQVIDHEETSVAALYTGYIIPLAAIGPIARLIGMTVFGLSIPFIGTYRMPIGTALTMAVVQFVLSLVGVYVLGLIIDALAPSFGGQKNSMQALKVAAYASTASWVVGIFGLVPMLGILAILGLYSLYLIYLGLPVLMRAPADKALPYSAAVIVSAIVLYFVLGMITSRFITYPTAGFPVR